MPILSLFWKFLRIFATDYDSSAVVTEDEFFQNHKRNTYAEQNVSNMKRAMGENICYNEVLSRIKLAPI